MALSIAIPDLPPALPFLNVENPQHVPDLIQEVAQTAFKELAISLVMTGIACCFIATPGGVAITLATTVGCVFLNTLLKAGQLGLEHLMKNDPNDREFYNFFSPIITFVRGIIFTEANTSFATLVHEGGHFLAIKLLFPQFAPSIEIFSEGGGVTRWGGVIPSGFWESCKGSRAVVSLAGVGAAIATSLGCLAAAHKLADSNPELSSYLNAWAAMNILHSALYALDAWLNPINNLRGHDFIALAGLGLNPLFLAVTMVAIPVILKCSMHAIDYYMQKPIP